MKIKFNNDYSLSKLKSLAEDESSCIYVKHIPEFPILIHPSRSGNAAKGVLETLDELKSTYNDHLNGVLVGYEDIKILPPGGWLFHTNPFIHVLISATFYVFTPVVGKVLQGVVSKKFHNHVACLVHNKFNVTSWRSNGEKDWCGDYVQEGDVLKLLVEFVNIKLHIPYICGSIDPTSVPERTEDELKNTSSIKGKKRTIFNDDDTGNFEDDSPTKSNKIKFENHSGEESEEENDSLDNDTFTMDKKIKFEMSSSEESEDEDSSTSMTSVQLKKKNKKKKANSKTEKHVILGKTKATLENNFEISKKKKKKIKSERLSNEEDDEGIDCNTSTKKIKFEQASSEESEGDDFSPNKTTVTLKTKKTKNKKKKENTKINSGKTKVNLDNTNTFEISTKKKNKLRESSSNEDSDNKMKVMRKSIKIKKEIIDDPDDIDRSSIKEKKRKRKISFDTSNNNIDSTFNKNKKIKLEKKASPVKSKSGTKIKKEQISSDDD